MLFQSGYFVQKAITPSILLDNIDTFKAHWHCLDIELLTLGGWNVDGIEGIMAFRTKSYLQKRYQYQYT